MSYSIFSQLFGSGRHSRLVEKFSQELRQQAEAYSPSATEVKRSIMHLQKLLRSKHATQTQKDNIVILITELSSKLAKQLREAIDTLHKSESYIDSLIWSLNTILKSDFATDAAKRSVLDMSEDLAKIHMDTAHSDTYEEEHAMCGSDYCAGYHSDYAGKDWRPAKFDF